MLAPIKIDGAVLILIAGLAADGSSLETAVMAYISPDTNTFFLSKYAMIQLGIIPPSFPQISSASSTYGSNINECTLSEPQIMLIP